MFIVFLSHKKKNNKETCLALGSGTANSLSLWDSVIASRGYLDGMGNAGCTCAALPSSQKTSKQLKNWTWYPRHQLPGSNGERQGHCSQVLLVCLLQLFLVLQPEYFFDGDHQPWLFDSQQGLLLVDLLAHRLHGLNARTHVMIGPDHQANAQLPEYISRGFIVFGRHYHQRVSALPLLRDIHFKALISQ